MFKLFIKSCHGNHFVSLFNMLTNGQLNNTLDIVSMAAFNYILIKLKVFKAAILCMFTYLK